MGKYSSEQKLANIQKFSRKRGRPKKQVVIYYNENMDFVRKVEELNLEGNLCENWRIFEQNFTVFATAIELDKKDEAVQVAILLNSLGSGAIEVFNSSLQLSEAEKKVYSKVLKAFKDFCAPKRNEVYESYVFQMRNQKLNEPFDTFLLDIKKLVKSCGYENENRMVRDRIVLGVQNKRLQTKLLETEGLTMEKAIDMARADEVMRKQTFNLQGASTSSSTQVHTMSTNYTNYTNTKSNKNFNKLPNKNYFNYVKKNKFAQNIDKRSRKLSGNEIIKCNYCGTKHMYGNCPAYKQKCKNCGKFNHFAIVCKAKNINELTDSNFITNANDSEDFIINSIEVNNLNNFNAQLKCWYEMLKLNDKFVKFKLDTGAEVNVLPLRLIQNINCLKLNQENIKLTAYGGGQVETIGECVIECCAKNEIAKLNFLIIKEDYAPILGLQACIQLKLIKRINSLQVNSKQEVVKKWKSNFEGLGCFIHNYKIELKENVTPVIKACRRVPLLLNTSLKTELNRMESLGIIVKCVEASDWVANLVIIEKPDKSLRLCLDPQDLNKCIKSEIHPIPTLEEIIPKLSNKKYFSVLDLKEGFFQAKLSEESSKLCTFNTPFGCYRFKRLPFGIKIAPEVFQKYNERNFEGINNIVIYIDDILIATETVEEHIKTITQLMERAKKLNIKFNESKFQYLLNKVKFLGYIFSEQGMSFDKNRIQAINDLGSPKNKKDVQKLLGIINYMHKSIPNLAHISAPLRSLLKKDTIFKWLPEHTEAHEKVKICLGNAPTLKHFNSNLPLTIQADSSQYGVGCCLLQQGHPIAFASKSLSDTEINYSQIEKEMLAICYACKKFHTWIYGRDILVETDHKPLLGIMNKYINKVGSARLQKMKIKLNNYKLTLQYLPGNKMYIADFLSRNFTLNKEETIQGLKDVIHSLNISDEKLKLFQIETEKDPNLKDLKTILLEGWPTNKKDLPNHIKQFWKCKTELTLENNIIFFNEKIFVPVSLRRYVLNLLHASHMGIEKTKARAIGVVYWPGISADIEDVIMSCRICQRLRSSSQKEPLIAHEIPPYPFMKIGMDICEYNSNNYLIIIDYYSKYLEIIDISTKTAATIIKKLKPIFSVHGIPREIVTDNMPFSSFEFKNFLKLNDIQITNSSPIYPRSNGQAERAVQIAKNMLKKAQDSENELWSFLLEYRNTPLKDIDLSPNQLLMGRQTRSLLPSKTTKFHITSHPDLTQNYKIKKMRYATYYNKTAKYKSDFQEGEEILYKNGNTWIEAKILKRSENPRSYWIALKESGKVLRRNSYFLRHFKNKRQ